MIRDGEATGKGEQEAPGRHPQFRDCFSDDTLYTHGQQQPTHYGFIQVPEEKSRCGDAIERRTAAPLFFVSPLETVGGLPEPTLSSVKLASALTAGMNPHHPGHSAAYPHHPSLSSSPHHPGPGGPHHAYGTGGGGGGGGGGGTTTTPDLPSPHSPQHTGGAGDPATPYGTLQPGQGMGSNGHHHSGGGMMQDHPHHPGHPHPHMPGHPAYPPVNHNNNCTLKQEGVPSGSTGLRQCAACGVQIVERWLLLAMDRYWHIGCLKCQCCSVVLGEVGQSCYTKSGMILCKADYRRLFGSSGVCSSCNNAIPANELVMRAGDAVFHLKCFSCNKCGGQLVSGDRYYLVSGTPVCESDWHKIVKSTSVAAAAGAAGNSGAPVRKGKVGRPRRSRE